MKIEVHYHPKPRVDDETTRAELQEMTRRVLGKFSFLFSWERPLAAQRVAWSFSIFCQRSSCSLLMAPRSSGQKTS